MIYLSWAGFYEGPTDRAYFEVLIPRLMQEIILGEGTGGTTTIPTASVLRLGSGGKRVEDVAREICDNASAFHLVFIHADTGGRRLAQSLDNRSTVYCHAVAERCRWHPDRCIVVAPMHETEAWALADPSAVASALGYRGSLDALGLPADAVAAERLPDPKAALQKISNAVRRRQRKMDASNLLTSIAQAQSFSSLRETSSFRSFEAALRSGLYSLGCLPGPS